MQIKISRPDCIRSAPRGHSNDPPSGMSVIEIRIMIKFTPMFIDVIVFSRRTFHIRFVVF